MTFHLCLPFIFPLLFATETRAGCIEEDPYSFSVEEFDMKINGTSNGIRVTWRSPCEKVEPQCYITEIQYRNQCVKNWTSLSTSNVKTVLDLTTLSLKHNYDFRMRMILDCIDGEWSNWTQVQSWGHNIENSRQGLTRQDGVCEVEPPSNLPMWIYVLITVLPMTIFLLICLLTQDSIRKLILPVVPDPKHFKSKFMDIDHTQWWGNLGQHIEECTTTEVEIVNKSENEDDQTVVIESVDDTLEHDNMYCIYSSETPGENTEQYSQRVCGYVVL